jgi:hypothetical protein
MENQVDTLMREKLLRFAPTASSAFYPFWFAGTIFD